MGPFGIAAVGLLAKKGSGSKQKRGRTRDANHSGSSHGLPQVGCADCLAEASSPGLSEETTGLSIARDSIGTFVVGTKTKPIQCEVSTSFVRKSAVLAATKQHEAVKASSGRKAKISASEVKLDSRVGAADPLVSGLSHIKARVHVDSVRTVDSALDTSESSSSVYMGLIEEGPSMYSRRQLRQAHERNEQIPIKLRRSGRISPDIADTLLLNMQCLSMDGTVLSNEFLHYKDTYNDASSVDNVRSSASVRSEKEHWERPEQLPSVNGAIYATEDLVHSSAPSNSESDRTTAKGLTVGISSFEKDLSQTTLQTMEIYDNKETDSPRFSALLRLTGGWSTKKTSTEIMSFSHELSSAVSTSHPYWLFPNLKNPEDIDDALQARFFSAKELVNSELALFGADLVDIIEAEEGKQDKDSQAKQEDLLVLARDCSVMSVSEFREQCEGIVQRLEEERQLLPLGRLKQLHIRLLIILTRCTRLLQYQKENATSKEGFIQYKSGVIGNVASLAVAKVGLGKKFYSQEQSMIDWKMKTPGALQAGVTEMPQVMADKKHGPNDPKFCKPPLAEKINPRISTSDDQSLCAAPLLPPKIKESLNSQKLGKEELSLEIDRLKGEELINRDESLTPRHWKRLLEDAHVICRICEEKVPTFCLEEHSHICALAVQCDVKGVSVDDCLCKLALILEKLIESRAPHTTLLLQADSPDKFKTCAFNQAVFTNKSKRFNVNDQGEDEVQDDPEPGTEVVSFRSLFGSKSEHSRASSSIGSITPKSPLIIGSYFDINLDDRVSLGESEDPLQIGDLADIARCVASTNVSESGALDYLASCFKDLQNLLQQCKDEALTIHTFGKRIEKLLRGKYLELFEALNATAASKSAAAKNAFTQGSPSQIFRPAPAIVPYKDRTSIEDFEIIKPISRGAFGRVFLARKRTTGDLFAIKVLRKADMIRKNAVESILAERNILISACNPFVVRFFYSFTCRDNLYLVMEYLIGGDLYSLLRNVGCLDEEVSQIYVAELVLALEYLHSLGVVHRDLKPDNLLIAHDGHLKLTDFGLSKVGLINSTDDLSGPCSSSSFFSTTDVGMPQIGSKQSQLRKKRQKHAAVGTPDYLAPEILLGTGHGNSADWWSTGIILFECLTGVPPFNAKHPQSIFENILNRKIPWPRVPEEMSADAKDLIDRLLTEDPVTRLGANGAAEVKKHPFFKNINWDTLARQKAAFVPAPESLHDTSYFTSRHCWNGSDGIANPSVGSGQPQYLSDEEERREKVDEQFDQPGDLVDFSSSPSSRFSFSNFSFKNLSQLASINYDLLIQNSKSEPIAFDEVGG